MTDNKINNCRCGGRAFVVTKQVNDGGHGGGKHIEAHIECTKCGIRTSSINLDYHKTDELTNYWNK